MSYRNILLVSAALLLCFHTSDALAEKEKGHKGVPHKERKEVHHQKGIKLFDDSDRLVIQHYLAKEYGKSCPPGLAKKGNGCLPPGQAKKYSIGAPFAGKWDPIPGGLLKNLRPVPAGYRYVMVDKDVLLIEEITKNVIDAITLSSALGQ